MKKCVITAGGTSERIDNVRKITNSSTGKLGMVIAEKLLEEIEDLTLYYICSKSALRPDDGRVVIVEVESTQELGDTVKKVLTENKIDYFVHSMAVSDYMTDYVTTLEKIEACIDSFEEDGFWDNIERLEANKISSNESNLVIVLKPTPKVISMIKDLSPETYLVGFKLLDGVFYKELIDVARKLRDKNSCDLVVANDLSNIRSGEHTAYIIDTYDNILKAQAKEDIAKKLVRKMVYER